MTASPISLGAVGREMLREHDDRGDAPVRQVLLSLTLICKDEKHNVKRLLDSAWEHVDEVIVVDTGSTDGTVAEFKRYAAKHPLYRKLKVAQVAWKDDFAAARQAADDLATGEFLVWADMDDTIVGLDRLAQMAAKADDDVRGFFVSYKYAADPDGNAISELWRERVVRNDGTPWTGRLHEHKLFTGGGHVVKVDPSIAEWVHHRDHEQRTAERNLRILQAWLDEEPDNPRVISSLALEYMGCERHKDAADLFARFLDCPGEPLDRRCQAARHMCVMLMLQGRVQEAKAAALQSLGESALWADTYLTLAEVEQTLGNPQAGFLHAQTALTIGKPDTLLIVNPLQYTAHPRALMAVCLAQQGQFEQAVKCAEQALEIAPSYQLAASQLPAWRGQLTKQHALGAFVSCTQVLVEHGELLKARKLLDCSPWFVAEDSQIVGQRVEVERLMKERLARPVLLADESADAFIERHLEVAA